MSQGASRSLHNVGLTATSGLHNTGGPIYTCALCGRAETVVLTGRGFPPDIAKRRLRKLCAANDCPCAPHYRAGVNFA